ncbi:hypothetical protein DL770_008739 [Monosporascus sp. CRB-9-2]|nr:hypothetical protein DL770_008739 [Monosporascus sp. CRB-9-2]
MSTANRTPEQTSAAAAKPQRVLACVLCQQRKIKCDRKFPCAKCIQASAQCVVAPERQRRRRFPKRELLERIRHYETLLRQNNIKFEPMHGPQAAVDRPSPTEDGRRDDSMRVDSAHSEELSLRTEKAAESLACNEPKGMAMKPASVFKLHLTIEIKNLDAEDQDNKGDDEDDENDSGFLHDNDDMRQAVVKKAWDHTYESETTDHLLFGSPKANVDIATLHPEQVQIFRFWQIYLENVDPLLKVTHAPTLQARIVSAASDVANINPSLEALMFSIYSVSILSLTEDECRASFGSPRKDLLKRYQFGCRLALLNCRVLRSSDRDCLTTLYLYLVSVRPETDPRSLSSILGVAIRIAQRMGIHNESSNAKCTPLEAEIRRRLWWSLAIFDNRICEMFDYNTATLAPTWDCRTPLNLNDFEIRPEMKTTPTVHDRPTEALFTVVRSELSDFLRHSTFHLDFSNPSLNTFAKVTRHPPAPERGELNTLERTMEDKYLAYCNPENPLHFMTIWTARGYLAKIRLLEHYSRCSGSSTEQTDTQRNTAISYALRMLECDTKLMNSYLTTGYLWLLRFYFPFPAYIHILQDLRKRPAEDHAENAWEFMSENYEARIMNTKIDDRPFFIVFSRIVLRAWEVREALFRRQDKPLQPPRIVSDIRHKVMQMTADSPYNSNMERWNDAASIDTDELLRPTPMDFGGHGVSYGTAGQAVTGPISWGCPYMPGQTPMNVDMNQLDWAAIDWNSILDEIERGNDDDDNT